MDPGQSAKKSRKERLKHHRTLRKRAQRIDRNAKKAANVNGADQHTTSGGGDDQEKCGNAQCLLPWDEAIMGCPRPENGNDDAFETNLLPSWSPNPDLVCSISTSLLAPSTSTPWQQPFPNGLVLIIACYTMLSYEVATAFEKRGEKRVAFHYYQRSMDEEADADATYHVALHYLYGMDVVYINEARAIDLLQLAIQRGSVSAHSLLAQCVSLGVGTRRNEQLAEEMNASKGDFYEVLSHCISMGQRLWQDRGRAQLEEETRAALVQLEAAAKSGDARAQLVFAEVRNRLVMAELTVDETVDHVIQESQYWWTLAASQGVALAQRHMGRRFKSGLKVDMVQAAKLYHMAAHQGDGEAQCYLGECYLRGHGCKQDADLAKLWFDKAAVSGVQRSRATSFLAHDFHDHNDQPQPLLPSLPRYNTRFPRAVSSFASVFQYSSPFPSPSPSSLDPCWARPRPQWTPM